MTMEHIDRSFAVSLHVVHPDIDPDAITAALGLNPKVQHRAGEQKRRLDGKPMEGRHHYSRTYWTHEFDVGQARDLVPFLEKLLPRLEKHHEFFAHVAVSGGNAELFCGIFMTTNWDEVLPHQLSERLAALKMDLRLDVYPKAEDGKRRLQDASESVTPPAVDQ